MRHVLFGATASLLIVGCGITSAKKNERKKEGDDASGVKAGASVNNQQFSLALPYLPEAKPNTYLKAHIRIFDSHVALPAAYVECGATGEPSVSGEVSMSDEAVSSGEVWYSAPTKPTAKEKDFALTQRPAKTIYDNSLEYKVGASIGPINLDPGLFTAILDVYDERGKRYTGTSWFEVKQGVVSYTDMKMEYVNDCGGSSGVVINPIIIGGPKDLVSACEFETIEIALCEKAVATCYYQDFKAHSECGLRQARQQLIGTLCQKDIKVAKDFKEALVCEVSEQQEPQPEPQPPKPQPKPAPTKPKPSPKPTVK
jgi:hypothetical protein